ncbi:MAG: ROK family protein [Dehalococcoidales bacterium]
MQKKSDSAPVIAADIGGTKILAALFSAGGKMLAKDTRPTLVEEGVSPIIERLVSAIDGLCRQNNIKPSGLGGIGIACAGGIDTGQGVVVTPSPNMPGWKDIPLADILRERFGVKIYLVNDASAAALGEHRFGAGKGVKDLVLLTLGTGIGGGIIADGSLYLGAVGAAGELGHMTVEDSGPECGCGNRGCLEMLASGTAIAREAIKRINQGGKSALEGMAGGKIENITAEMVGAAARSGDSLAKEVIARAAYYLGVGLVNIVNIFNPEMVILGGGMAGLGDLLTGPGKCMVAERAFSISSHAVRIVTAQLGNEAGVYGAAVFAREKIRGGRRENT